MSELLKVGDIRNGYEILPKEKRKTILLLSDDLTSNSGIGNMSKEFVLGTCHYYNWVQLAGAINHPKKGQILDISKSVEEETGVPDPHILLYPIDGYGNPELLREILRREKIDLLLHFTDPRFWIWLYMMENEIRRNIPITYYAIWDDTPYPHYNELFYRSCDLIMGISKQSHNIHRNVLGEEFCFEFDTRKNKASVEKEKFYDDDGLKTVISYVPHGINEKYYFPMEKNETTKIKLSNLKNKLFPENDEIEFIVLFNNRNIRRKMMGDVMLAFVEFVSNLPEEDRNKCGLIMHTQARDENGTDLIAIKNDLFPNSNIVIDDTKVTAEELNQYYNLSDVTINIASNEGFGLSSAESLMAGTMVLNNVTGGLQDQVRFSDENKKWIDFSDIFSSNHAKKYSTHGKWAEVVFPKTRSLVGAVPTPYIFDDRCDWEEVAEKLRNIFNLSKEARNEYGLQGHIWVRSDESMMSARKMAENMMNSIEFLLSVWKKRKRFKVSNSNEMVRKNKKNTGILSYKNKNKVI